MTFFPRCVRGWVRPRCICLYVMIVWGEDYSVILSGSPGKSMFVPEGIKVVYNDCSKILLPKGHYRLYFTVSRQSLYGHNKNKLYMAALVLVTTYIVTKVSMLREEVVRIARVEAVYLCSY
jgi:hypothetical protein